MTDDDPFATQRDMVVKVPEELRAAGFDDPHLIGRGGFGVVYRCTQSSLDRTVAVKVLESDLDEDNRERFFREQRAMGRLTGHPNIVNVLHVGTTDSGRPYIVMPFHPHDSLDVQIRRHGPLSLADTLGLGVKMAGALETAHRLGILHRDVKPANILVTDYGEPALTDFGIAHLAGGFETSTGTITGSPAFTAPEVLEGGAPSPASDIYSLGATLFCVATGHAAFERRSGEHLVAQFLRITTHPVPDLREQGIPADLSAVIEQAMATDPRARPATAAEFGEALRQIQLRGGFPVDEMPLQVEPTAAQGEQGPPITLSHSARTTSAPRREMGLSAGRSGAGNVPLELTSFIGRRHEMTEVKDRLSVSPLVTLAGIGGVGKTRLALRVAADVQRRFTDGARVVELGELRDDSLLVDVVAAALGLRSQSARPLLEVVVEYLIPRRVLLVLDNCEHLVDAVAELAEALLHVCPDLRILATSREPLGIGGEAVLRVPPLSAPDPDHPPTLRGMPQYDAVTLFAQRAAAAVPGFEVTEDNRVAITRICRQLDGLPLSIELAAARLRAMSPEQILQRLTDRYTLLTLGNRGAPTRQQTLALSIDWSHDLCTPREQQVWARLSVFAGGFELDAAEHVCGGTVAPEELLDTLTALVDKSILNREEVDTIVRFRMLETLRDYGREKLRHSDESPSIHRRHRDWYQQLVMTAEADWISPHQLQWIARLKREQSNLRAAMEFCLTQPSEIDAGLRIAVALFPFWLSRSMLSEGRRWFDRLLAWEPAHPTAERIQALCADSMLAEVQGDLTASTTLVGHGKALAATMTDAVIDAHIAHAEGVLALYSGDLPRACRNLEDALQVFRTQNDLSQQVWILMLLGVAYELRDDTARGIVCHEEVLAITETHHESVNRSYSLWAMGIAVLRQGDPARSAHLLEQGLQLTRVIDEPVTAAVCLEALAWTCDDHNAHRAAVLMGAAESLGHAVGSSPILFHNHSLHHENCVQMARQSLGERAFLDAQHKGAALTFTEAVAYAIGEQPHPTTPTSDDAPHLTTRERQVSELVAQGLTNKAIANTLVISPRTAQGHVEHILTKLGFTSRAQIAAWVAEQAQNT
ncbi:protein kinase domain-containing protein [Rhodococcus koreensis]|uniref:protein kinase domain-containing protein n=1 Tax=Rhodococcus koreensis TaxID=99653 RepID=UPI0036D83CC4